MLGGENHGRNTCFTSLNTSGGGARQPALVVAIICPGVGTPFRGALQELQCRLAYVYWMIKMSLGEFDKTALDWLRPIVASYSGLNASPQLADFLERMSTLAPDQIEALSQAQAEKAAGVQTLMLKKYPAPLLESKTALLSSLETELQNRLYEIRVYLSLINEDVDQFRYYFQQTFNSNLSESSRDVIIRNLTDCQRVVASHAKQIVDHIDKIVW